MSLKIKLLGLLSLLTYATQAQVESSAYKALLETMYSKTVPLVSCAELKKMRKVVLLDTREKKEYDVSHLPNARWVGYKDFDIQRISDIPKNANVVLYCSVGYRSEKIGEKLQKAGFQKVNNLYGSIFEWINQGNTVYDNAGKPTTRVHAYSDKWGVWVNKGEKVYD